MSTAAELTVLAALALMVLFFWRIKWGLYSLMFVLPFERIGSWALNPVTGHPVIRVSQLVGVALVLAYAAQVVMKKQKLIWHRVFTLLGLFVLSAGVSAALIQQKQLIYGWVALAFVALLAFVVAQISAKDRWASLVSALFAGAVVVSLFGIYQFVAGSLGLPANLTGLRPAYERLIFGFPRVQSTALEPLYFANYLLIPLLVGLAISLMQPSSLRRWQKLALPLFLLAFILTMSRGAFLAVIPASLLVVGLALQKRVNFKRFTPIITAFVLCSVLAVGLISFAAHSSKLGNGGRTFWYEITQGITSGGSFTERAQMRAEAVAVFRSHPWFGVGIEGISPYVHHYPATRSPNDVVAFNNQALELLDEVGIVGTLIFYMFLIALLFYILVLALKSGESAWPVGLIAVAIAMTIQAQSYSGFLLTHMWVVFGLLGGVALNQKRRATV
jgi:hypothetical protein